MKLYRIFPDQPKVLCTLIKTSRTIFALNAKMVYLNVLWEYSLKTSGVLRITTITHTESRIKLFYIIPHSASDKDAQHQSYLFSIDYTTFRSAFISRFDQKKFKTTRVEVHALYFKDILRTIQSRYTSKPYLFRSH